jgi:hypothetical protein
MALFLSAEFCGNFVSHSVIEAQDICSKKEMDDLTSEPFQLCFTKVVGDI